jgi:predicted transcriptional regulator
MSAERPITPASGEYSVRAPDGTPVTTYRRARGGTTKRLNYRQRRPIVRVGLTDRHSQLAGRDIQPNAQDRFHAPEQDIARMERFALDRGYQIAARTSFLNYTGAEFERLEPFLQMMEADPPTLDAMIFTNWQRFSRAPEGLLIVERVRRAGGDLLFVDTPSLDIYDPHAEPWIAFLNAMAAMPVSKGRADARDLKEQLAKDGRAAHAIWGYRKRELSEEVVLPDGSRKEFKVGTLVPDEAEFSLGTQAYDLLYAGMSDSQLARWLNDRQQRPRGFRRRRPDGTIGEVPRETWTPGMVRRWRMNPINKGWIVHGEFVNEDAHPGLTSVEKWDAVNAARQGSKTGSSRNPGLASGILRCQSCRSAIPMTRNRQGRPLRYQCNSEDCPAKASIEASLVHPLIEERLYAQLLANRQLLEAQAISGNEAEVTRLRQAKEQAEARKARIWTNVVLADENPARYKALSQAAEAEVEEMAKALKAVIQRTQAEILVHDAVEDWLTLSVGEKRQLLDSIYPIIWLRPVENINPEGELIRVTDAEERLWFIARGEHEEFLLPRKGQGWVPESHEPVSWPDGSRVVTHKERIRRRGNKIVAPIPVSASEEDMVRWREARAHYLAHGRTAEEVTEALAGFSINAGARELGMSTAALWKRSEKLRGRGSLDSDPRTRRKELKRARHAEALEAVARHGSVASAARALGVHPRTMAYRYRGAGRQRDAGEASGGARRSEGERSVST